MTTRSDPIEDEAKCLRAFMPPLQIARPKMLTSCIVFASPHSGDIYPANFTRQSALAKIQLRRNEDAFIDQLFAPCPHFGAPLLSARFPRCFVDVNRAADELPPGWAETDGPDTARTEAGYGVIPLAIAENTPIYKTPPTPDIAKARLETLYHPYHNALKALTKDAKSKFGRAVLVDCHSMPGFAPMGARRADIVLGDRYGKSCHPRTIAQIERAFQGQGFSVTRNYPYAGGFVTEHYGRPDDDIEAIQIEINRDLYLNPVTLKPKRSYQSFAKKLEFIIVKIIQEPVDQKLAAAE